LENVFAAFGSAAHDAQYFELALENLLSVCKQVSGEAPTLADLDADPHPRTFLTMGMLVGEFKQRVTVSDESIVADFRMALKLRNFLMHRFFVERIEKFNTEDGRREMIAELTEAKKLLDKAGTYTRAMAEGLQATLDGTRVEREGETLFSIEVKGPGED
jgi:hypothetical protein